MTDDYSLNDVDDLRDLLAEAESEIEDLRGRSSIESIEDRVVARVLQELGDALVSVDMAYSDQRPDLRATLRGLGLELRERAERIAADLLKDEDKNPYDSTAHDQVGT